MQKTARQQWLQLTTTTKRHALVEAVYENFGAEAITLLEADDGLTVELEPHQQPGFELSRVVGLFAVDADAKAIEQALAQALGEDINCQAQILQQQDWENAWTQYHPPLCFADKLWVAPHNAQIETRPDQKILRLDPGLAFGTGTHPTTALCLEWLAQTDLTGKTFLDYGCGSGILAIAALLLGAKHVVAVDIDSQAIRATQANAQANGVAHHISTPGINDLDDQQFEIVLANILANPLLGLAPTLSKHCQNNGQIVLSGLLSRHIKQIQHAYASWFNFDAPEIQQDWVRLTATKSA